MLLLSFVEQVTRLELASSPHKSSLLRGKPYLLSCKNAAHRIFEVEAASSLSLDGLRKIMALSGDRKIGAGDEARTRFITPQKPAFVGKAVPPVLQKMRHTAFLRWRQRVRAFDGLRKIMALSGAGKIGAGDEARTRYLHLGKVALYQMSYTCISRCTIQSMHLPGKYSRSP